MPVAGEYEDRLSILIVDDDVPLRNLICDVIRTAVSCSLRETDNGIEALELFRKRHYDLVISDLKMPGMDGIASIKEINQATPVIIMTGHPSIDASVSAMKYGAADFLVKPFKIDDLILKVNLCLKEKTIPAKHDANLNINNSKLTEKIREVSTVSYIYDAIEKMSVDDDDIFQEIAAFALKITGGETCSLLLFDEESGSFYPKVIVKNANDNDHSNADKMISSLKAVYEETMQKKEAILRNSNGNSETYNSLMCVPLTIRNKVFGLLTLVNENRADNFTQKDLNYISILTTRASLNIENRILYESIFCSIMDTFKSLVQSIQARDYYTERHSKSVTQLAVKIAEAMQLSKSELECLEVASILHDIGKIAIPDNVLLKPGRLIEEEYNITKTHSVIGENILKSLKLLETERKIVRHHHERWDGMGYPDGLSGKDIPFLSRIISVADAFDAMTSDRPYRKALKVEGAINELKRNCDTQFDRNVVAAFISTLR